jgi:hypothetical protein
VPNAVAAVVAYIRDVLPAVFDGSDGAGGNHRLLVALRSLVRHSGDAVSKDLHHLGVRASGLDMASTPSANATIA